jgi:hypothetical protein
MSDVIAEDEAYIYEILQENYLEESSRLLSDEGESESIATMIIISSLLKNSSGGLDATSHSIDTSQLK